MDALAGQVTQCLVHQALPGHARKAGKGGTFDFHGKVRFARAIVAQMAAVACRIVDHRQMAGGQGINKFTFDFLGNRAGHIFPFGLARTMCNGVKHDKFHGRVTDTGRLCSAPGCDAPGEFRAPGVRPPGFDGPGEYRWFCLDHIRAFNAGYDFFDGMSMDEILAAQSPIAGWDTYTRAFRPDAGIDQAPRWTDFADPLEAIAQRARARKADHQAAQEAARRGFNPQDRAAFETLNLPLDADRHALRRRYADLVRRYHPDHNGGDRSLEDKLQRVVAAYDHLRQSAAFR